MLTVPRNEAYLFVALQIRNQAALPPIPADPDTNPVGIIYRDVNGAPVLATEISGGSVTFVKQASSTGFYGIGLPITFTTPLGRYWIRVEYTVVAAPYADLIQFEVVEPGNSILEALSSIG